MKTEAPITLYTAILDILRERYCSYFMAFLVAANEFSQHQKHLEIQYVLSAFLSLTKIQLPPEIKSPEAPTADMYVEGLKNAKDKCFGNFSLALSTVLKQIAATDPDAHQLRGTLQAYEKMISTSLLARGLLGFVEIHGSPKAAVTAALYGCLEQDALEQIDGTIQAANSVFGCRWPALEQPNQPMSNINPTI